MVFFSFSISWSFFSNSYFSCSARGSWQRKRTENRSHRWTAIVQLNSVWCDMSTQILIQFNTLLSRQTLLGCSPARAPCRCWLRGCDCWWTAHVSSPAGWSDWRHPPVYWRNAPLARLPMVRSLSWHPGGEAKFMLVIKRRGDNTLRANPSFIPAPHNITEHEVPTAFKCLSVHYMADCRVINTSSAVYLFLLFLVQMLCKEMTHTLQSVIFWRPVEVQTAEQSDLKPSAHRWRCLSHRRHLQPGSPVTKPSSFLSPAGFSFCPSFRRLPSLVTLAKMCLRCFAKRKIFFN